MYVGDINIDILLLNPGRLFVIMIYLTRPPPLWMTSTEEDICKLLSYEKGQTKI